jgi:hypothetical protein
MDRAKDWASLSASFWILRTNKPADEWYARFKPVLHADDSILIMEVNLQNRRGWLPSNIVQWLSKDHTLYRPGE